MLLFSKWKFKWKVPQSVAGYISLQGWLTLLVSSGADFIGLVSVAVDTIRANIVRDWRKRPVPHWELWITAFWECLFCSF